jgi:proliferating cell nuclear antigen
MEILLEKSSKTDIFTTIFQSLKSFSNAVNVQFNKEGMYIQAMDNAHISILEINLPHTWFCQYKCDVDSITLGINTSMFHKILSSRVNDQYIKIQYDGNSDKVDIEMASAQDTKVESKTSSHIGFHRKFQAPLMDIEADSLLIPEVQYQIEMTLKSLSLSTLVQQLRGFSDTVNIKCNEEHILFLSESTENGSMTVEILIDDVIEFSIEEDCNIDVFFALQYLHQLGAYSKISPQVNVKLHTEYPLMLEYPLEDDGFIKYFLAPKINDE